MQLPINYKESSSETRRLAREEYVKQQKGLCLHCGYPLEGSPAPVMLRKRIDEKLYPVNFFKWPVHLHHDHNTEMTLGAVHAYCNAVLWEYHNQ